MAKYMLLLHDDPSIVRDDEPGTDAEGHREVRELGTAG